MWPTKREDSKSAIKFLVNHYILRHGFLSRIHFYNGTQFKNTDLQQVEKMLGLKHVSGTFCHPQSQGKVEFMIEILKKNQLKLSKLARCITSGINDNKRFSK